ncbi:hypothetical protein VNPA141826_32310 [Pseudomonas aeruginosa]|nr:hypothetical protein VNPA141826_32310 [Pseudomonas aeruginosa]
MPKAEVQLRLGSTHWLAPSEVQTMASHSSTEQDRKMMEALRKGPITTLEAANDLDIVHPPNTIRRLRNKGHEIITHWTYQATDPGRPPHRVAKYVLLREAS